MFSAEAKFAEVFKKMEAFGPEVVRNARIAAIKTAQDQVLAKLRERVLPKVPQMFGTLHRSITDEKTAGGFRIGFGGQASKYAERIHEDESISHTGTRSGKWVYLSGGGGFTQEGDLNEPRKGGTKTWRYASVQYVQRLPASDKPKVGQAHFLFGASNSAWAEIEQDETKRLVDAIQASVEDTLADLEASTGGA